MQHISESVFLYRPIVFWNRLPSAEIGIGRNWKDGCLTRPTSIDQKNISMIPSQPTYMQQQPAGRCLACYRLLARMIVLELNSSHLIGYYRLGQLCYCIAISELILINMWHTQLFKVIVIVHCPHLTHSAEFRIKTLNHV